MKFEKLFIDCIPILAALVGVLNTVVKYILGSKKKPSDVLKFLKGDDYMDLENGSPQLEEGYKQTLARISGQLTEIAKELEALIDGK